MAWSGNIILQKTFVRLVGQQLYFNVLPTHNKGQSVNAKSFIKTLKSKI